MLRLGIGLIESALTEGVSGVKERKVPCDILNLSIESTSVGCTGRDEIADGSHNSILIPIFLPLCFMILL